MTAPEDAPNGVEPQIELRRGLVAVTNYVDPRQYKSGFLAVRQEATTIGQFVYDAAVKHRPTPVEREDYYPIPILRVEDPSRILPTVGERFATDNGAYYRYVVNSQEASHLVDIQTGDEGFLPESDDLDDVIPLESRGYDFKGSIDMQTTRAKPASGSYIINNLDQIGALVLSREELEKFLRISSRFGGF